jgi:zinc D-Ala-D-Ala carboxypeptidase
MEFLDGVCDVVGGLIQKTGLTLSWTFRFWRIPQVNKWRHFSDAEVSGLDTELVAKLDMAREKAGVPFIITSGLRTVEQNAALSESVSDSAHLTGHAVDLACTDSPARFAMVKSLLDVGFTRMGIYSAHLHVDNDLTKPQQLLWYVAGT